MCVDLPHLCTEGDPFADKTSLYYKDAMAAQVLHVEQQERKAALHKAAVSLAASLKQGSDAHAQLTASKMVAHEK